MSEKNKLPDSFTISDDVMKIKVAVKKKEIIDPKWDDDRGEWTVPDWWHKYYSEEQWCE